MLKSKINEIIQIKNIVPIEKQKQEEKQELNKLYDKIKQELNDQSYNLYNKIEEEIDKVLNQKMSFSEIDFIGLTKIIDEINNLNINDFLSKYKNIHKNKIIDFNKIIYKINDDIYFFLFRYCKDQYPKKMEIQENFINFINKLNIFYEKISLNKNEDENDVIKTIKLIINEILFIKNNNNNKIKDEDSEIFKDLEEKKKNLQKYNINKSFSSIAIKE